jgi:glycyl-tRNA synthetase
MMFETSVGATEETSSQTFLRPETAQGIFTNFKNIIDTFHPNLPFGIAQIGKAFRNEITARDFLFRMREFEQMEVEYFVREEDWEKAFEDWRKFMHEWLEIIGLDKEKVHELEVEEGDLAHYSKRTIDFEYDYPFGRKELYGLAYRTDYDLKKHKEASGASLEFIEENGERATPHVIEPSLGIDRTILALLDSVYDEEENEGETRVVLRFNPLVAPTTIAVLPLMKKDGLAEKAKEIFQMLLPNLRTSYDETGSIGKRYRRQDEVGTPFCVTVDYDSLENGDVTVRDRDTMKQERVAISDLENYLSQKMA